MTNEPLSPAFDDVRPGEHIGRHRLLVMPWMPWRIFEGRQVPGRDTPRDNPEGEFGYGTPRDNEDLGPEND